MRVHSDAHVEILRYLWDGHPVSVLDESRTMHQINAGIKIMPAIQVPFHATAGESRADSPIRKFPIGL